MNKNITVEEILKATNGTLIYGNKLEECESFSKNTKEIKDGDVYIGFKGERFDGGKFYEDALKNGAKGAMINKIDGLEIKRLENKFVIQVDDTVEAVGQIAKLKREKYNIPVIAITGSVGKTSTKDIIYSVVSQKYNALKTQGNMNNHIGMPMTILGLRDHEALVVEMGMNHFGEISLLTDIAKPTLVVITNIGTSHIGNLGSRENILKAKLEILEGMKIPKVIINNDNDLLHDWYEKNKDKIEIHTVGIENNSELMAKSIELGEESSEFKAIAEKKETEIQVPVAGTHFVYNNVGPYLAGILVQRRAGCDLVSYLTPRLFSHIGIKRPTWETDPLGNSFGAGGLFLTLSELHKFGLFYLNKGKWNGKQILSEEWIEESTKPSDTDYYGYLFWRGEYNSFRADGKYSQLSIVIPDKNTVISLVAECRKGEELMRALYDFVCSKL